MMTWSEWLGYTYKRHDFDLTKAREEYEKYLKNGLEVD